MSKKLKFSVYGLEKPDRLDRVLRDRFPTWGRKAVKSLVNSRKVKVNGRTVWLGSWKVCNGDELEISEPPAAKPQSPSVFEDAWLISVEPDLIVVDKPFGLLSHATRDRNKGNLFDLASQRFGPLTLFHRLDRDTSGVVLLTRTREMNRYLDTVFKAKKVQKEYLAVVPAKNNLEAEGDITTYIGQNPEQPTRSMVVSRGGKSAKTHYQAIAQSRGLEVVKIWPQTGRMHQIRVHMAHMGAPILGDILYASPEIIRRANRLLLHAARITLPAEGEYPLREYSAPLPNDFLAQLPRELIEKMFND